MKPLNRTKAIWDRQTRNDININWDIIENNLGGSGQQSAEALTKANEALRKANSADNKSTEAVVTADSVQQQLNNIVIESGTSSAEVIQARGGYDVLNTRLTQKEDEFSTQLAKTNGILIESFGDVGNGNDDAEIFIEAFNFCTANGYTLLLSSPNYKIESDVFDIATPSIKSVLPTGSEIDIYANFRGLINDGFTLEALTFNLYNQQNDPIESLFFAQFLIADVTIKKVRYYNKDDKRNRTLLRAKVSNLLVSDVTIKGADMPFVINGKSKDITFENVRIFDFKTGIYITSGAMTSVLPEEDRIKNVNLYNVIGTNTLEEQENYEVVIGSDLILFEWVEHVNISNVQCTRAIERMMYLNCCSDVNIDNVTSYHGDGIKFVGSNSIGYLADGLTITNYKVFGGTPRGYDVSYGVISYSAKNINVLNAEFDGENIDVPTLNSFIFFEGDVDGVTIKNVKGRYLRRGFLDNSFSAYPIDKSTIKNLVVDDVDVLNPVRSGEYAAFKFHVLTGYSGYQFENIDISNVKIKQLSTVENTNEDHLNYYYRSRLTALIDINNIKRLRTKNNSVSNYKNGTGFIAVGVNSYDCIVNENTFINGVYSATGHNNLYLSGGSVIRHIDNGITITFTFKDDSVDQLITRNITNGTKVDCKVGTAIKNAMVIRLPFHDGYHVGYGSLCFNNNEYLTFSVNSSGITKVSGSENAVINYASGKVGIRKRDDIQMLEVFNATSTELFVVLDYMVA